MSINWNALVKDAETDLTRALASRVAQGIVTSLPWLSAVAGPLAFVIGLIVGQLVKYGDWLAYYLGDEWMNTSHGQTYQLAGEALASLSPTATKEEIDAAKKAKSDAFDVMFGAP